MNIIKVKENIIKLREDLGRRNTLFLVIALSVLAIVLVIIFAYRPLVLKLGSAKRELHNLHNQLVVQRDNIAVLKKIDARRSLMQQNEVSLAIDELTEAGRNRGLKFTSITPEELQHSSHGNVKVLPITFKIECAYASLGKFFTYLEEFPRSIAAVKSFTIRSREEILPQLDVVVVVNIYMEGMN